MKIKRIEQAIGIDKIKQYLEIGMEPLGDPMMTQSGTVHLIMVKYEEEEVSDAVVENGPQAESAVLPPETSDHAADALSAALPLMTNFDVVAPKKPSTYKRKS